MRAMLTGAAESSEGGLVLIDQAASVKSYKIN